MTEVAYFDEVFSDFFEEIGDDYRKELRPGQIVWTHFPYTYENLEIWRPSSMDTSSTIATNFNIRTEVSDRFNRTTPLSSPRLASNEEFLVVRAKRRPSIIITLPPPKINIKDIRGGGKINIDVGLIAPLFSVEDDEGSSKYRAEFINKVRMLQYPSLFFLPAHETYSIKNSICRYDKITNSFFAHLEPENLCINDEVLAILTSQLCSFIKGVFDEDYKDAYDLINQQ